MKLKIPPVVLLIICGVVLWLIGRYWLPAYSYSFAGQLLLSRGIMIGAVMPGLWAIAIFRKNGTTTDPANPSKASVLVTTGVYTRTRNPMYLTMLFILIAGIVKVGNPIAIVVPIFFVWYMSRYQIKPEEKALRALFGEEYLAYCKSVRRWV